MTPSPDSPDGYLQTLTPRVLWSPPDPVRDRPIMGALLGQQSTLVIETGASPRHAAQFSAALASFNAAPARFAALTHWHWDHVFGTATLALPTIAHAETRQRVLEMARLDWRDHALDARVAAGEELAFIAEHVKVEMTSAERGRLVITPPDLTFTDQLDVDLGGLTAQIIHVGGDHARDSSVIYAVEEQVAFIGDCFYEGFIGAEHFLTCARLYPLLDQLEALPAAYYVLSHHPAPLARAEFLHDVDTLRRIGRLFQSAGPQREAILAQLPAALGRPASEDDAFYVDSFLRGLQPDIP